MSGYVVHPNPRPRQPCTITVGNLISSLKAAIAGGAIDEDALVVMASDPEGNEINPLESISFDRRKRVSFWPRHHGC